MKYLVTMLLSFLLLSVNAQSSLIEQIKTHTDGIGLWWAGHNIWIIKSGDLVISTDILLDYDKRAIPSSISAEELAEVLDISFITHGQKDHFNRSTSQVLAEKSDCKFVLPQNCVSIAKELNLPK
jgi:L-ascorbate metabolism protein UlaG (beta-lactamase superfamily)